MIRIVLIIWLLHGVVKAQYIQNGSFEGNTACAGNCTDSSFPPWKICSFSPDLLRNVNACFNFNAPDSTYYLAFGKLGGISERVGQQVGDTLRAGKEYVFSGYFRDFQKPCYITGYDTSLLLFQVYMGRSSCSMDTLVLEIAVDSIDSFQYKEKRFSLYRDYTHIVFSVRSTMGDPGTKYCLVDRVGIREDTPVDVEEDVQDSKKGRVLSFH